MQFTRLPPARMLLLMGVGLALVLGTLALWTLGRGLAALRERRVLAGTFRGLWAALLLCGAGLLASLSFSLQGYRALSREVVVAYIEVQPTGPERFRARVEEPGGRLWEFELAGDQLYVDARILKWKTWANLLGLHTAYALDRVGGRYADIEAERRRPRSVHALGEPPLLDVFALRRSYAWLAPLLDAEYGSATFIASDAPAHYEVRVSTSGLLVRERPREGLASRLP